MVGGLSCLYKSLYKLNKNKVGQRAEEELVMENNIKAMMEAMKATQERANAPVLSSLNVLVSKVDVIDAKVDTIIEAINKKANKVAVGTESSVTVVKCDCCGVVIKSQKVIDYCKARKFDGVFCPKCQADKGLVGKNFRVKELKPEVIGFAAKCTYCGRTFKHFDTQAARAEYNKKCVDRGYKGMICAKCVNGEHGEVAMPQIEMPKGMEEKIMETNDREYDRTHGTVALERQRNEDKKQARCIDDVQKAVDFLISLGYTKEVIMSTKIGELRKIGEANSKIVEVDGNTWNKTKLTVIEKRLADNKQETQMTFTVLPEDVEVDGEPQEF